MNRTRMTSNYKQVVADVEGGTRANAQAAALFAEAEIKRTLHGQRSGHTYIVTKTGRPHTASAPGEAPARLAGDLVGSITTAPDPSSTALYYVGSDKLYAPILELGSKYMEPRPFFVTSINAALRKIRARMAERIP